MIRRIAAGRWPRGAPIPGEEALAREFGCARATVNRALQDLARSGLLERRRRAGTRVALHPVREARFAIPLVRAEIEARGGHYDYRLIERSLGSIPEAAAARLGARPGARGLHVTALHLADGEPYQLEDRWIVLETVPDAEHQNFAEASPNEWLVATAPFSRAIFGFLAGRASEREAAILGLAPGDPVLIGERTTWLGEQPITFVRMLYRPGHRIETEV
jgi:GntR family histidine utilization transcriptional repressor